MLKMLALTQITTPYLYDRHANMPTNIKSLTQSKVAAGRSFIATYAQKGIFR